MKALKSNFYLIRVDKTPVYIGYTNRPIKTRFREHLHDKDFGDGEVTVEELDSLSFPFTWDINLINQYVKEVSKRETALIAEYGTATSVWQKGINGDIGGQVWNDVKNFVRTNRYNPKFSGLSEDEILAYLQREDIARQYMRNFVTTLQDPMSVYMGHFVSHMEYPVVVYMRTFVSHMEYPVVVYMRNFVTTMQDATTIYMRSFVNHIEDTTSRYMKDFVNDMKLPEEQYMKLFVNRIEDLTAVYMRHFVSHMESSTASYMHNFVSHMSKKG